MTMKKPKKKIPPEEWRQVSESFWWRSDVGSASRCADGWYGHLGSYEEPIVDPRVGPFSTAEEAIIAYEKIRGL
jgi:hypothetical protein